MTPEEVILWLSEFIVLIFKGIGIIVGIFVACFVVYMIIMTMIAIIIATIRYKNPFKIMKVITKE